MRWPLVMEAAEHIRATIRPWTEEAMLAACDAAEHLTTTERQFLAGLFWDAICWDGKADDVTDGQHRLCAIRCSTAQHVMITN